MISDILFEALESIEWYERKYPETYTEELTKLKEHVRAVQQKLDTAPVRTEGETTNDGY